MILTELFSDNIRELKSMSTSFDGKYIGMYNYAIRDKECIQELHEYIKEHFTPINGLSVDTGFVFDLKHNDGEFYVVVQSLYNSIDVDTLSETLSLLSDYVAEITAKGAKECLPVDCYGEKGDRLYSFDIAFLIPKNKIYGNQNQL